MKINIELSFHPAAFKADSSDANTIEISNIKKY